MEKPVRDVTCINDLTPGYIDRIVNMAVSTYHDLRVGDQTRFLNFLKGKNCFLLFQQASTRTYSSFNGAFRKLGAENIDGIKSQEESSLSKGESLFHTVDTHVGQGVHFYVTRTAVEGAAKWASICAFRSFSKKLRSDAKHLGIYPSNLILPVIFNGGDGQHNHPSQFLLDCSTIKHELGEYRNLNFGECNDIGGSRVVSSHIDGAGIMGWKMHLSAFPNAGLNPRQMCSVLKSGATVTLHDGTKEMLRFLNLLYVSRFQFNLRGEKTGDHAEKLFSEKFPRISLELIKPFSLKVFHARPIDSNAQEIDSDMYNHPLDCSGIQSDFGIPTRMAMCMYAIENGLLGLKGIIKSLDPTAVGYFKDNLQGSACKQIESERYTAARISNGFVIDHIPVGCGVAIHSLILNLFPGITSVLSSNVEGASGNKDVIKLHVNADFSWNKELDNIVALFSEVTANKSCRVSHFAEGKRISKWTFRVANNGESFCTNPKCITRPERHEHISFKHTTTTIKGREIKICPFCEWPQEPEIITELFEQT